MEYENNGSLSVRTSPVPPALVFEFENHTLLILLTGITYIDVLDKPDWQGKDVYIHLSDGKQFSVTKDELENALAKIQ